MEAQKICAFIIILDVESFFLRCWSTGREPSGDAEARVADHWATNQAEIRIDGQKWAVADGSVL